MRRPIAVLMIAGMLLSACGDDGTTTSIGDGNDTATTAGSLSPGTAIAAPDALQFEAPAVGGGAIDFRQYAGTTVALWFWAPT